MQEGFVDLTFPNTAELLDITNNIAKWLRSHSIPSVIAVQTGKASALRIEVPLLKVKEPFENTLESDLNKCFEAIADLSELADIFLCADRIKNIKKHER